MKNFPKLKRLLIIPILLLSLTLFGCEQESFKVEKVFSSQNGNNVIFEGVIYYVSSDAYYVADETGYIFVSRPEVEETILKVGDKVSVDGYYSFFESFRKITMTKSITLLEENQNTITPSFTTIYDINNLSSNDKSAYSKLINLTGYYVSNDKVDFILDVNDNYLRVEGLPEEIEVHDTFNANYIIKSYDYDKFTLEYVGGMVKRDFDINDVKPLINAELESLVPTVIYSSSSADIFKPLQYEKNQLFDTLTSKFNVSFEIQFSGTDLSYSSYKLSGVNETKNVNYDVKVTIKKDSYTFTKECTLMSNKFYSVDQLIENEPSINWDNVFGTGIVIAKLHNESANVYTLIIRDKNSNNTIPLVFHTCYNLDGTKLSNNINYSNSNFTKIKIGDEIEFNARYNTKGDYSHTYDGITAITVKSSNNNTNIDFGSAKVLKDRKDYDEVAANYRNYIGKLIKFENPYLSYSGSKGTVSKSILPLYTCDERALYDTFVYDKYTEVKETFNEECEYYILSDDEYVLVDIEEFDEETKYYTKEVVSKLFAFNLTVNSDIIGSTYWYDSVEIPNKNENYKQVGRDFYCYIIPSTGSYIQLIIADFDYVVGDDYNYLSVVKNEVISSFTTDLQEQKIYTLKTSFDNFTCEYSTDNSFITIKNVNSNIILTFQKDVNPINTTIKCVVKNKENCKEINEEFEIPVHITNKNYLNVSQLSGIADSSYIYSRGVVIGYASETNKSTADTKRLYKGLIIKDLSTNDLIIVDGLEQFLNQSYPEGDKSNTCFTINSNNIIIGTVLEFGGKYYKDQKRVSDIYALKFIQQNPTLAIIDDSNITTVHNQTELSNAVSYFDENNNCHFNYAKIIKLVGTEESPILFTPTSSNEEKSSGQMNFRIHYNKKATNSTQTMINGYSIAIKQNNQIANTGVSKWYETLGLPEIGVSGNLYPGCAAFVGEMYVVVCYTCISSDGINSCYNACSIVNWTNWTLEEIPDFIGSIQRDKNE